MKEQESAISKVFFRALWVSETVLPSSEETLASHASLHSPLPAESLPLAPTPENPASRPLAASNASAGQRLNLTSPSPLPIPSAASMPLQGMVPLTNVLQSPTSPQPLAEAASL